MYDTKYQNKKMWKPETRAPGLPLRGEKKKEILDVVNNRRPNCFVTEK
jgi:hypothetical protein